MTKAKHVTHEYICLKCVFSHNKLSEDYRRVCPCFLSSILWTDMSTQQNHVPHMLNALIRCVQVHRQMQCTQFMCFTSRGQQVKYSRLGLPRIYTKCKRAAWRFKEVTRLSVTQHQFTPGGLTENSVYSISSNSCCFSPCLFLSDVVLGATH